MANVIYPKALERASAASPMNWLAGTIKVVALDSGYTYNAAHEYLDDIPAGARVATSSALTGKTAVDGVIDADDVAFGAISGDPVVSLVIYEDTGVESTSALLIFIDGFSTFTPNGSAPLNVTWSNGADKIARL